jgi:hypothetical protein
LSDLAFARSRLRVFLEEIARLTDSEFPYAHSETALRDIAQLFQEKLELLNRITPENNPEVVKNQCGLSLQALFEYLPVLGVLLRSTNVRNAFEVFRPLLRLANDVLEPGLAPEARRTRVVLSSEWDYSPLSYNSIRDFPHLVLIGLPAPESDNPLLLSLAGHELGHTLWAQRRLDRVLRPKIKAKLLDLIQVHWADYKQFFPFVRHHRDLTSDLLAMETWLQSEEWAVLQIKEIFCDFVGLALFRESFLHAFAYLLSPNGGGSRSPGYPEMLERVRFHIAAAKEFDVTCPDTYLNQFSSQGQPTLTPGDEFRLSLADKASTAIHAELFGLVKEHLKPVVDFRPNTEGEGAGPNAPQDRASETLRILHRFEQVIPAERCGSLRDILNAAWMAYLAPDLWQGKKVIAENRDRVLKHLVLKNIELFEIEQLLGPV